MTRIPSRNYHSDAYLRHVGTSRIIHAQAVLAMRKKEELLPNTAFDEHGEITTDPEKALKGALAVWGGVKGTGLSIAV